MFRLKPRFSLAAMLALVLLCALAAWTYWIGWPSWVAYRAGVRFEEMAKELQAGPAYGLFKLVPDDRIVSCVQMFDVHNTPLEIYPFEFKYSWYCVYIKPSSATVRYDPRFPARQRWDEVRVYRLKPPPPNYRAQTAAGSAKHVSHLRTPPAPVDPDSTEQYWRDFYQIAAGYEDRDLGIEFELVHADTIDRAE
jgi:hypothetical protein